MNIFELQRNIHLIDLKDIGKDVLLGNESRALIVELQKKQLLQGKDSDGEDIKPLYRSGSYSAVKQRMNSLPSYGTPDLKLTGSFHRSIYFDANTISLKSSDAKTPSLMEKYGEQTLGLNEDSIEEYRPYFDYRLTEEFIMRLEGR